jgi:hypothetical protein
VGLCLHGGCQLVDAGRGADFQGLEGGELGFRDLGALPERAGGAGEGADVDAVELGTAQSNASPGRLVKDLSPSARFINTSPTYRVKAAAPCNSRSITDDLRWGDYFGRAVNLAARIASQAAAKQVFVGEDLVRGVEPVGFDPASSASST